VRVLVDESTGAAVVAYLRSRGHDVLAVAETLPQATDAVILARATDEGRLVVTNDKDFGELAFRSGQLHTGILLLRLRDERGANRVRVVASVFERWGDHLLGAFTVATERGVRIRPTQRPS
jgi:predicted nuclease of predicted toxin-antitoxin system